MHTLYGIQGLLEGLIVGLQLLILFAELLFLSLDLIEHAVKHLVDQLQLVAPIMGNRPEKSPRAIWAAALVR